MKSLETNVLARFFIDDPDDAQAVLQRPAAVLALTESSLVTVTVILELEWVMRGFYGLARTALTNGSASGLSIGNDREGQAHLEILGQSKASHEGKRKDPGSFATPGPLP